MSTGLEVFLEVCGMRKSEHGWKIFIVERFQLIVINKVSKLRHTKEDEWVGGRVYHIKVNQRESKLEEISNGR